MADINQDKNVMHTKAFLNCIEINRTNGYLVIFFLQFHNVFLLISAAPLALIAVMAFFGVEGVIKNAMFGIWLWLITLAAYPMYIKFIVNTWARLNDMTTDQSNFSETKRKQLSNFYEND
jgi:hypothetical protein